jgi:hypothetical protein
LLLKAYLAGGVAALVCVAIAIYYLTPGVYHVLAFDDYYGRHIKHALVFFGLAIVSLIAARFVANARAIPPETNS